MAERDSQASSLRETEGALSAERSGWMGNSPKGARITFLSKRSPNLQADVLL